MNLRYTILLSVSLLLPAAIQAQTPEQRLIDLLKSGASPAQKADACRELKTVGTEASVPVLAGMLVDPATSHGARIALESMPYASAGAALRDAVAKTTGLVRSGIIDSIGERRDAAAVGLLAPSLEDEDLQVVASAATALGKIGTVDAAKALRRAATAAEGPARTPIAEGIVTCADRLFASGRADEALRTLERACPAPKAAAVSIERGEMKVHAAKDASYISQRLNCPIDSVRFAAMGRLPFVSTADLAKVAAEMAMYPPSSQISVLAAIRIRGDASLIGPALEAVKSSDESVRIAAVRALGGIGGVKALPVLLELAATEDKVGDAAREGLEMACGSNIEESLVAALRAERDSARRVEWIALLETRHAAVAVPALLEQALCTDADVRGRAMKALAKLAAPKDVAGMIPAVLKAEPGEERDSAEKAVMLVCLQEPRANERATPIVAALEKAAAADRVALLPLLGRVGGPAAMQRIQAALADADAATYDAGVRALANWPDGSVAADLLKLARTAKTEPQRHAALHGLIRVAVLPGKADADKLALLKEAMGMASRDEERNYVLQRAGAVRTVESLRFILPAMEQPALSQQACKSVCELAHHKELRNPNLAEFKPALDKVLKVSTDAATLERARRYLQGN